MNEMEGVKREVYNKPIHERGVCVCVGMAPYSVLLASLVDAEAVQRVFLPGPPHAAAAASPSCPPAPPLPPGFSLLQGQRVLCRHHQESMRKEDEEATKSLPVAFLLGAAAPSRIFLAKRRKRREPVRVGAAFTGGGRGGGAEGREGGGQAKAKNKCSGHPGGGASEDGVNPRETSLRGRTAWGNLSAGREGGRDPVAVSTCPS